MAYKKRSKATVTRRAGGTWVVDLYGLKGENLGHFEFDDVGTYWIVQYGG